MTRYLTALIATVAGLLTLGSTGLAQAPGAAATPQTTIKLHVVLSKYQGDKSISSQPYTLSLVPKERGNLRIGSEVPVRTGNPPAANATPPYSMQSVGTQIDATVTPTSDGKYHLDLAINDRSVYTGPQVAQTSERVPNVPVFRNVNATSKAILSNGETMQFTTAIDQVSNETFKVDVTLNVGNK
jgi:type II secretory pathway component HofQ